MSDLDELYQYVVLDHNNNPRNFKKLDKVNRTADGYNPICGDKITLFLQLTSSSSPEKTVIADVGFLGSGCAISKASASMMTQSIKGKSQAEAEELFSAFRSMVTNEHILNEQEKDKLGDLSILSGVWNYPARVKCAILSWHTLRAALYGEDDSISTE